MLKRSNRWGAFLRVGMLGAGLVLGTAFRPAKTGLAQPQQTAPVPTASNSPLRVSGISIKPDANGPTIVEIATSSHPLYRLTQLKHPSRLVIDISGAVRATSRKTYPAASRSLFRVRVGQLTDKAPSVVRVVLDLRGRPHLQVHDLPVGIQVEIGPHLAAGIVPAAMTKTSGGGMNPPVESNSVPQPAAPPPASTQSPPLATPSTPPPGVPAAPPPQAGPSVLYVPSPFRSPAQNEKLLDTLGLRGVLNFGYRKGQPNEAHWKTEGAPGVEASRLFIKPISANSYRTIELAVTSPPQGPSEVAIYGEEVDGGVSNPNPDVSSFQQVALQEVSTIQQAPPPSDMMHMSYAIYNLSYVKADRAMALLKTMGYTTVEYNSQAGESLYEMVYNPLKLGPGKPPIIIKLIDASKTSLQQPATATVPGAPGAPGVPAQAGAPMAGGGGAGFSGVPEIGGSYLSDMTAGDPQQRLLIVYDNNDSESLQSVVTFLQNTVDVPARQIMIEALVIELTSDITRQLGVTAATTQSNQYSANSQGLSVPVGTPASPFTFTFDKNALMTPSQFTATLSALLTTNKAQVLSNPSVLVLDDRQARIQIAEQRPIFQQTINFGVQAASVSYVPIGIVLNLRPRISDDGSEITMQTETIVSAEGLTVSSGTTSAPIISNREVQSFVRVADNTPFIIGGLTANDVKNTTNGIPFLSQIPGLGALFRTTTAEKIRQEVIIVVTPHVIPKEDKYFSYIIPKDSSEFDRTDWQLFRNAYRISDKDRFDLEFVYDSNVYKQLVSRVKAGTAIDPVLGKTEPFGSVLKGEAPGEDVLVQRMLWEIIHRTKFYANVDSRNIIFFKDNPSAPGGAGFDVPLLFDELKGLKDGHNALSLTFEANPQGSAEQPLVPPKATLNFEHVTRETYPRTLLAGNDRNPDGTQKHWMILLSNDGNYSGIEHTNTVTPLEFLQSVIVLHRVLELNKDVPLTLNEFHVGRQIIFPTQEELKHGYLLVDREVARLFYEIINYYGVFEQRFDQQTREMNAKLDKIVPRSSTQ